MKKLMTLLLLTTLAVYSAAQAGTPALDLDNPVEVEGIIAAIAMDPGSSYPSLSIQVEDGSLVTVITAPFWFFTNQEFQLTEGDSVMVDACNCIDCELPELHALRIVNLSSDSEIILRDDNGLPLWKSGRQFGGLNGGGQLADGTCDGSGPTNDDPGNGNDGDNRQGDGECDGDGSQGGNGQNGSSLNNGSGNGNNGAGAQSGLLPDMEAAFELNGTVIVTSMTLGSGPSTIQVDDTVVQCGPVWYLTANGFSVAVGDELEILAAPCLDNPDLILALEIHNISTGETIVLRNENGFPLWR